MHPFHLPTALVILPLLLSILSCSPEKEKVEEPDYWPTTKWRISSPEDQGMDSELLAEMLEQIQSRNIGIDSIHVIRNGRLVLDTYIPPYREQDRHIIHSCTKSIMSLLIGIALERGDIASLDQPVLEFFPGRKVKNLSEEKTRLTLRHLLTMSTGLDSRDSYLYRWEGLSRMRASGDWVGHILDLPVTAAPGSRFDYSNMASYLLSAIITETTGKIALAYGREHLFGPLGITDIEWPSDPRGNNIGWGEMRLKPLDLAKIGWLVLNDGRWEERRIVSADYLKEATSVQIEAGTLQRYYGFQWWVKEPGLFMALGYAGQYLIVYPEKNLVTVFTSALAEREFHTPDNLFSSFIVPSLVSDDPLPEDPEARRRLESVSRGLAHPEGGAIPQFPETAGEVNGRTYDLEENPYDMTAVSFLFGEQTAEIHEYYGERMVVFPIGLSGRYLVNEEEHVAVTGEWEDHRRFRTIFAGQGEAWWFDQLTVFEEESIRLVFRGSGGDFFTLRGTLRAGD